MSIKEELIQYANDCISGKIISGKKHKQACQRMLSDFEKSDVNYVLSEEFPYYWDENEAVKIVKWFSYLKHSKGALAGQFIQLTIWQKFILCQIYGWRQIETGYKRFSLSFVEVGRKNAKSQMEAGVILYEMATQSTKNGEIYECYCAGTKRDQSKIIFTECKNLLNGSPLRSKFKLQRDKIIHIKTGSFLVALCKEDGRKGDGTNPAVLVLDEYHQHETTEFYDLGMGANSKESLLMIITTAGKDLSVPCYIEEYQFCSKLLDPNDNTVENENYFADICEVDPEDDINQMDNWKKANPVRMSYESGIVKIKKAYEIAKAIPEKMTAFLTKMLNIWVQQADHAYMDMSKWRECEVKQIPWDLQGHPVYVGFDMSSKIDLTSVAFILPILSDELDATGKRVVKYVCFSHSFMPNRKVMQERMYRDKVKYDAWERNQYLTLTNSEIVDQNIVMRYVLDTCEKNKWEIQCLCFDTSNAGKLMMDFSNEGYDVEEVYQSARSLNESTTGFREQVYAKNIVYLPNPLLNFAMGNTVTKTQGGYIKIDKDANKKKIDPVDAMLCAFKLALYHEFFISTSVEEWLDSEEW